MEQQLPTRDQPTPPVKVVLELSTRPQFDPADAGFSLLADEETLLEIESIQDETVKAAHETLKFAWR
jgi:hypothetical protein